MPTDPVDPDFDSSSSRPLDASLQPSSGEALLSPGTTATGSGTSLSPEVEEPSSDGEEPDVD